MCVVVGLFVVFAFVWVALFALFTLYPTLRMWGNKPKSVNKVNKATQIKANTTNKPNITHKTICVYSTVYPSPSEGQQ